MEWNSAGAQPQQEELTASLDELSVFNSQLKMALEDSNARVIAAEQELEALRGQHDAARQSLELSAARAKEMEVQVAELEAKLEQAAVDLEAERGHWQKRYQEEKEVSEGLRQALEALRLQLGETSQGPSQEAGEMGPCEGTPVQEENTAVEEALLSPGAARAGDGADPEPSGVKSWSFEPLPSLLLSLEDLVSAAKGGDGRAAPLGLDEEALRRNLRDALQRLEGIEGIQGKWRKQMEKWEEVEKEWKDRLAALEQDREELSREVELLQEDLRREQDLAMEGGLVAEEEWRKRQEAEREVAQLKRDLAKQKKVAKEALMCIPRSSSISLESALSDEPTSPGPGPAHLPTVLSIPSSPITSPGPHPGLLPQSPAQELLLSPRAMIDSLQAVEEEEKHVEPGTSSGPTLSKGGDSGSVGAFKAPQVEEDFESLLQQATGCAPGAKAERKALSSDELDKSTSEKATVQTPDDALEQSSSLEEKRVEGVEAGKGKEAIPSATAAAAAEEVMVRLGQEVSTLRKEVLDLRMKLAEVRHVMQGVESEKREVEQRSCFRRVCLQLVTNTRDKFEEQIAMATRHALEASQKARESDRQLFALLGFIASLLKEHQVQAKNNGSTYNKYKIGSKEIEIVKEDLRQLVKYVQMKATLAEKGRQKNKTKAAVDAARPRLAELRDGAVQEEEVLAELERELDEARKRTEEAEKMHSMVAAMREKERLVREHMEREVRAVQAKMQEAEIMKEQVEALKRTEQVLAKELADEVRGLKAKTLEAEEVEGRIDALEATESVIREEAEAKTMRVREIEKQFPRLMGLSLASELPPPGLLGRKPQEELAWREKRKVLEDLKTMREQLIWTQQNLLKSRQRLPELIQETKESKRKVEEKEKETKRLQQWLKEHEGNFARARGGGVADADVRKSSSWSWWRKREDGEGTPRAPMPMPLPRVHPSVSLGGGGQGQDESRLTGPGHAQTQAQAQYEGDAAVRSYMTPLTSSPSFRPLDVHRMMIGTAKMAGPLETSASAGESHIHREEDPQQPQLHQEPEQPGLKSPLPSSAGGTFPAAATPASPSARALAPAPAALGDVQVDEHTGPSEGAAQEG